MRLNYYTFPEGTEEKVLLENGCPVLLKGGGEAYVPIIPEEKRPLVEKIGDTLGPMTVTAVKKLIRKYGGSGYTEHIDRCGHVFEVTEIELNGNNSRFRYNHHL